MSNMSRRTFLERMGVGMAASVCGLSLGERICAAEKQIPPPGRHRFVTVDSGACVGYWRTGTTGYLLMRDGSLIPWVDYDR